MDNLVQDMLIDLIDCDISHYEEKSIILTNKYQLQLDTTFDLLYPNSIIENAYDIPGLFYIKNYLTMSEIDTILNKIHSEIIFKPITTAPTSRLVAHFGYNYSYDRSGIKPADPIPTDLTNIVNINKINNICGENIISNPFDQLIINEYKPGQQIAPHTDHVTQFGPIIACITVGKSVPIIFTLGSIKKIINVESGSMYIMTKDSRYLWKHSLKNTSDGTRYSLTYRTIVK